MGSRRRSARQTTDIIDLGGVISPRRSTDYGLGSGQSDVYLNGGTGEIDFGAGASVQDVYLQADSYGNLTVKIRNDATDSVVVHNDLIQQAWGVLSGISQLVFADGTSVPVGNRVWAGGPP